MALKESPYVPGIKELLLSLEPGSLHSLAATATNHRLMPVNSKEAVEVVLLYTENLARLFSYKRITSQVLFDYLHKKKATVRAGESKPELIERVKQEWEHSFAVKETKSEAPHEAGVTQGAVSTLEVKSDTRRQRTSIDINININSCSVKVDLTSPGDKVNVDVLQGHNDSSSSSSSSSVSGSRSDVFVQEFCTWFFTMLNRLQPQWVGLAGDTFSPDAFMANCCMDMYLYGAQNAEKHASGQHNVYSLLKDVCTDYKLSFVPHLDSGVQVEMSKHGLVKVLCCGTLHEGNSMAGVFEQEFGLVKCPQGRWRIMMTKINLRQAQSSACLPVLPKSPVFDIPP